MRDAGIREHGYDVAEEPVDNGPLEPIAIVGMGMRLPGAIHTVEEFWKLLVQKRSTRNRVPSNRFNIDSFYSPSGKVGSIVTEHAHFLADEDNLEYLDTSFFSMSRKEVEKMDPQQRMLLEVVHECMENAGQTNWRGKDTGVYVGVWGEDWMDIHAKDAQDAGLYRIAGAHDYAISNRISYEYDLHGPSSTIKTACSSSLMGVHEAVQAIRSGSCSSAIVAGTNLIISATMSIGMTEQGVLSPEGRCKTFDASANGYARGEAINAVYLKKLSDAVRDGDPVRAVIRHTAANSDGKTPGMSMPSSEAHERLFKTAYREINLNPADTAFVELHGTGTPIGDPLEASAVGRVFGGERGVYIGSVKPNMGHSEGASGLTSVIKAVMALEHSIIPPNINFITPNPKIPFAEANMRVPVEPIPWPQSQAERVSINSFGIGGANAHIILDSAASFGLGSAIALTSGISMSDSLTDKTSPSSSSSEGTVSSGSSINISTPDEMFPDGTDRCKPHLIVASAENSQSLQSNITGIKNYTEEHTGRLDDISYNLCNRRQHFSNRSFCVATDPNNLAFSPPAKLKNPPSLAFVFTGQGAQWGGMAKELMHDFPSFDSDIAMLNDVLQSLPDAPSWDIKSELLKIGPMSFLDKAIYAQPLVTAVQIALVNLLQSWSIHPAAVVGHSSGEMAAAYAAGAITAEEAIIIAYYRGQVTTKVTQRGGMAALGLGRDAVAPLLSAGVVIACENSGSSVTLSGGLEALNIVCANIREVFPDAFMRRLQVEMAYHSHHMHEVGETYELLLSSRIKSKKPAIPFFSSVRGKLLSQAGDFDASYWRSNLEHPVVFHSAVKLLLDTQSLDQLFLEVGPHAALGGPLRQILKAAGRKNDSYSTALQRGMDCTASLFQMAGELHLQGIPLEFTQISPSENILTDLPLYKWKHDESYWSESRISKNWRLRKFPEHELLGCRTMESTDLEPEWRNVLRIEDSPWLRDHQIIEDIVFPAAGYLCMAIEAVRQITAAEDFSFRNVVVQTALVLSDDSLAELVTTFRPTKLTNTLDSVWWEFSINSYNGNTWMKHCSGQIRAGQEAPIQSKLVETYTRPVPEPYTAMKKIGLNYGPAFQGVENCSALPNQKTASASLTSAFTSESVYAMHPTTIDHCLQIITVAASEGLARNLNKLCVPTNFDSLYIGPYKKNASMRIEASASLSTTGMILGDVFGMSDGVVNFSLLGGKFSPIESDNSSDKTDDIAGARLTWKAHLDFVPLKDLIRPRGNSRQYQHDIEQLGLLSIAEIQRQIASLTPTQEFLQKFKTWIDGQVSKARADDYALVADSSSILKMPPAEQLALIQHIEAKLRGTECGPAAELVSRIRKQCRELMDESIEGIALLLPDDGLTHFYNALEARTNCSDFFASAGHLKPTTRVLEIGAGTGGTSAVVLKALTLQHDRLYASYTYTDVSSGFFATAQERFKHNDGIQYKVLDISKDPILQGFEQGGYDLIVAANVLHATPNLKETLTNVRKLLAPEGRLFLQELSPEIHSINLIMGILPGWWLGEVDGRAQQPYVSPDRWNIELKAAGFSGVDTAIYDEAFPYHQNANIISRPSKEASKISRVTLLAGHNSLPEVKLLTKGLEDYGYAVDCCSLRDDPPTAQPIISLLEFNNPFFEEVSSEYYELFQRFIQNLGENALLWVTRPAQLRVTDPRFSISLGLMRSLRAELSLRIATLELDSTESSTTEIMINVLQRFQGQFGDDSDIDNEFILEKGIVKIGRFHPVDITEELLAAPVEGDVARLQIGKFGLLQTLKWQSCAPEKMESDEDVLVCMGIVEANGLGLEGSGVITQVGTDVKDLFTVGDRVLYLDQNCFSTRSTISAKRCAKIPDWMSWEEAATMPCVYATVIHSLLDAGRLRRGQSVLIHSACGGVGLSAIQICQNVVGAEIYVTVGNEEKAKYLMNTFGIPRERIFNSRDTSFLSAIKAATNGRGVDIVLNSLSGELLHASWNCVAEYGKMIEIGKRDFIGKAKLNMDLFEYNRSFIGVDLARFDADMIQPLLEQVCKLADAGKIKPISPIKVFDGGKVEDAFRYMQKGAHIGKIVVTIPKDQATLPVALSTKPLHLNPKASYLLVGGLGGLGRAISTWMVENGARNLVYLSRSAGKSTSDQAFFAELASQGCVAKAVPGDVSVLGDVSKAVSAAPAPIKGVLQLSMVLRDCSFLNMSKSDWDSAINPKVAGTWNLHNSFGKNLDFFLATSSISGTFGNAGQANYAAANTFLSNFMEWRRVHSLAGSVIDVGFMSDIGYVSQNAGIAAAINAGGAYGLQEQALLDALHWAIVSSPSSSGLESNVAIGVRSSKALSDSSCRVPWKRDIRMGAYWNVKEAASQSSDGGADVLKDFIVRVEADPLVLNTETAKELVTTEIGKKIYMFMMQPPEELDVSISLAALGVDSLVTIEVRNWIKRACGGVDLSTLEILGAGTIEGVGGKVIEGLKGKYLSKAGVNDTGSQEVKSRAGEMKFLENKNFLTS